VSDRPPPDPPRADLALARRLVLAHGWNATAYQILNPGLQRWFAPAGDATVAFASHRGVTVVAGAPVCAPERLADVVAEFEAARATAGDRVCYFAAGSRLESLLHGRPDRAAVLLGAQPVWDPSRFGAGVRAHASLRAQLHRARNKGVEIAEWPRERATASPALTRLLDEWLGGRGLPSLHFLIEPQTLGRLWDRRVFVAERAGAPVAFLVASPVPARAGWLVEQIVRGGDAPNGTTELLVAAAMDALARDGARYATLGLAPLSTRAAIPAPPMPRWLELTFAWTRAHGRRFYDFDGLDAFKAKLRPTSWEGIYAISHERRFSVRTLRAIAEAFSGGSATALVARAVWRAMRDEARRLAGRGAS
jgi:phosphatidylglycerol lysyltransferase